MHATDPHALDPSVEAYIERARHGRFNHPAPTVDSTFQGELLYAEASIIGWLKLSFGGHQEINIFPHPWNRREGHQTYALARDLAAAINGVLARHAAPPATVDVMAERDPLRFLPQAAE